MLKWLLIFGVIVVGVWLYRNKIKIKFRTFFRKGFRPTRGKYGVYLYDGKQGMGKTYSVVEYLLENKDKRIYANIKSLQGVKYTPIKDFDDLLALRNETDCIIFYDEIFTALTRSSKIDTDVLDFLSQMRKRRIIFLTTAQEWLEIPITLRRYCRYRINCRMLTFFGLGILFKTFYDGENMSWSNEDNEYVAPLLESSISKCNLRVSRSYDTFEQINTKQNKKKTDTDLINIA